MLNSTLVGASSHCRVTEGHEFSVIGGKKIPGFFCTFVEHNYHKSSHEERSICLFGVVERGIVVNLEVFILGVIHQLFKLFAK